jgi:phage/conjugal plasmid C-4 type zinc finger TraR family protein
VTADIIDRAQELERRQREAAIAAARSPLRPGPSRTHCEECGAVIPEKRRIAVLGVRFCTACQRAQEEQ